MKSLVYVGWNEYSTVAYLSAVAFARYKVTSKHVKVEPLPYEPHTLRSIIPRESPHIFYLFGSFAESDIRGFLDRNARITLVGKLYGGVFDKLSKPAKVKQIKLYPVPKEHMQGLEYLDTLSRYFGGFSEADFFMRLLSAKDELRTVLATTDGWVDAFNHLVSPEVTTGPEDIPRVIDHIKKKYRFDEEYSKLVSELRSSVVDDRGVFGIVKVGPNLAKKSVILGKQVLNRWNIAVLVASSPPQKVYVVSAEPIPASVAMAIGATVGGKMVFHSGKIVMYEVAGDEKTLIEKLRVAMELLPARGGRVRREAGKNYRFWTRTGVTTT